MFGFILAATARSYFFLRRFMPTHCNMAVMERTGGAEGRTTVCERRYAEALRDSRAVRTRSRPKMNSSAGS